MNKDKLSTICTVVTAFVGGSLTGAVAFDGLGLPGALPSLLGAMAAAVIYLSPWPRAFWQRSLKGE